MVAPRMAALEAHIMVKSLPVMPSMTSMIAVWVDWSLKMGWKGRLDAVEGLLVGGDEADVVVKAR